MGTHPINKLIFGMALPPIISMVMQSLYNIVDSIFLAKVSEDALTAVTLIFPVQMLLMALSAGMATGVVSLISRRLGEKNQAAADSAATHGIVLAILVWVVAAFCAIFLAGTFMGLFIDPVAEKNIYDMGILYFRIIGIGSLPIGILVIIERTVQATGNMIYPMISSVTGAVINLILAPIFIIGYFGVPGYGIAGAGAVAVFGQSVGFCVGLWYLTRKVKTIRINLKGFRPDFKIIRDIYVVGAPSIVMMAIGSFFTSGLNAILISFSNSAVAVLGVYFRMQTFVLMPVNGLGQGAMPVMGYNYGAKNRLRLMAAFKLQMKLMFVIVCVGFAVFQLFAPQLMSLFSAEGEMLEIGLHALRIVSYHFLIAACVIPCVMFFQATAHAVFALIISVVRQLAFLLPICWFLAFHFGVNASWFAFPVAEGLTAILALLFFRNVYQKEIRLIPDGPSVT
jgi:putative MATE family efflux protein